VEPLGIAVLVAVVLAIGLAGEHARANRWRERAKQWRARYDQEREAYQAIFGDDN